MSGSSYRSCGCSSFYPSPFGTGSARIFSCLFFFAPDVQWTRVRTEDPSTHYTHTDRQADKKTALRYWRGAGKTQVDFEIQIEARARRG